MLRPGKLLAGQGADDCSDSILSKQGKALRRRCVLESSTRSSLLTDTLAPSLHLRCA